MNNQINKYLPEGEIRINIQIKKVYWEDKNYIENINFIHTFNINEESSYKHLPLKDQITKIIGMLLIVKFPFLADKITWWADYKFNFVTYNVTELNNPEDDFKIELHKYYNISKQYSIWYGVDLFK